MKIRPAARLTGSVILPGDKSISHRAAIIGALAEGGTRISNFASSADCASTLECVKALGASVVRKGSDVTIEGAGKQGLSVPNEDLDCGNSGTTARLLAGVLAGQPFESTLDGDGSLRGRPMNRVIKPLSLMGAEFDSETGTLPMMVRGARRLNAIEYEMPVASAQVKSAVLLAGLNADGVTKVSSPPADAPGPSSRNHTEIMLRSFGAPVLERNIERAGKFIHEVSVSGDSKLLGRDVIVPGDVSGSAFFLVAAACLEGSDLTIADAGLNPTRTAVIEVLRGLGASIETSVLSEGEAEPAGTIRVRGGVEAPSGLSIVSGGRIANLIDELPILAVFGTQLEDGLEVRDAAELRHKESDRISAVVANLKRMGAEVEEFEDGFRVGRSALAGARLDSYGDHRIAMAFAVASLFAEGESEITGADCVTVSFPDFFKVLEDVVR
jgi:3-phosphoshikimate 1-carboxyvinyltransferase